MQRLADLRDITTLDEAKQCLADLARLECNIAVAEARAEREIAKKKATLADLTAADRSAHSEAQQRLCSFILTHKGLFEKPRKICTEFGLFGLQTVTELEIIDEPRLTAFLLNHPDGLEDCIKTEPRLVKNAIKKALELPPQAEVLAGMARIRTGDTAVYKVSKALIEEAEKAIGAKE